MSKKAFFFLRHNNDIDHITPVLYKWLSKGDINTEVIIDNTEKFLEDHRIKYLRKFKNVKIYTMSSLLKKSGFFGSFYKKIYEFRYKFSSPWILRKFIFEKKILEAIDKDLFNGIDEGLVVFDWTGNRFRLKIVKIANKKGFTTVSLPHGDEPRFNIMFNKNSLRYDFTYPNYKKFAIFDYVVVPNHLMKRRFDCIDNNKVKILGSPRFCDEWMKILSDIKPSFDFKEGKSKVKVLIFLRGVDLPIFWEEVARTIKFISEFPEIYLIVKYHPRRKVGLKELYDAKNLPNVRYVLHEIPSETLIDWADLIIDVGATSVTWDPIKKGKPVLMPEYLHANHSTIAHYIKESELRYRDQLYDFLKEFVKNKNMTFYRSGGRERFIKEMIDVPDKNVLDNYYSFLKKCLEETKNH